MSRCGARLGLGLALVVLTQGCGSDGAFGSAAPQQPSSIILSLTNLRALDPVTEGSYQAWLVTAGQPTTLGRFAGASSVTLPVSSRISDGTELWITVERPGSAGASPSAQRLLRGAFRNGVADLSLVGAVTQGTLTLRQRPGQFTMFSPSDNAIDGYPSYEESGVWLFNMAPRSTDQNDMWVRLSQLDPGWTYEGWMVRDIGQANAIWLSYGKFTPDYTGAVNSRDDTGWGPFSGVANYKTDGEEEFPGDDWISNPLNLPFPKDLTLPLNLRETTSNGTQRWTHVITIEPAFDRGEPVGSSRPFLLQPYRDLFGMGAPGEARTITYHPETLPSGRAEAK
jgi:Anti-sigma-K factor rskA